MQVPDDLGVAQAAGYEREYLRLSGSECRRGRTHPAHENRGDARSQRDLITSDRSDAGRDLLLRRDLARRGVRSRSSDFRV